MRTDRIVPISKPLLGEEEKRAVSEVIDSGMYAQGERVKRFEKVFADYAGTKHAVATLNGTTALMIALNALDVSKGEVLVPSFSFIATATSVVYNNAKPIFVDIDQKTFNMDPEDAERRITKNAKAIMPVHLYGQTAEMDRLGEIAEKHGLKLIEDAAQAHGAEFGGNRAGSFGDCACFSFYPTKNMTTAEGGIVTTNDSELAEKMRLYRNHGQSEQYMHVTLGYNFRMTEIQAALGLVQMGRIDKFTKTRRKNAAYYDENLKGKVEKPYVHPKAKHVYHQYTIRSDRRDELEGYLKSNGVGCKVYYPLPIHRQPVFNLRLNLPNTEKACEEVLSIPVHPALTREDLEFVANTVNSFQ